MNLLVMASLMHLSNVIGLLCAVLDEEAQDSVLSSYVCLCGDRYMYIPLDVLLHWPG